MIETIPFMLRLSKHEVPFFSSLLKNRWQIITSVCAQR